MFWMLIEILKRRFLYLKLAIRDKDIRDGLAYLFLPISLEAIRKMEPYYLTSVGFPLRHSDIEGTNAFHYHVATLTLLDYAYKKQLKYNKRTPQYYKMRKHPYPITEIVRYARMFKVEALALDIPVLELYLENYTRLDIEGFREEYEMILDIKIEDKYVTDYLVNNVDKIRENELPIKLTRGQRNVMYSYLKVKERI